MKQIGHMRGREDYCIFEPEKGDRLFVESGRVSTLWVISNGERLCSTDKANYPSLGGVTFCGGLEDEDGRHREMVFVTDPCWVAANVLAIRRL